MSNLILWVDSEFCCLDEDHGHLVEIACRCSDENLNFVSSIFHKVFQHNNCTHISKWAEAHFKLKSNLANTSLFDDMMTTPDSLESAKSEFITYLTKIRNGRRKLMMAGCSVYFDQARIRNWIGSTEFDKHFVHRVIDVSTILLLVKMWAPKTQGLYRRKHVAAHRAPQDMYDSKNLLHQFKSNLFFSSS